MQIRNTLPTVDRRPLLAPDESARQRVLEVLDDAAAWPARDADMTHVNQSPPVPPIPTTGQVILSRAEMARLERLVQLATTTIGELNLWLASAGKPLDPEDR